VAVVVVDAVLLGIARAHRERRPSSRSITQSAGSAAQRFRTMPTGGRCRRARSWCASPCFLGSGRQPGDAGIGQGAWEPFATRRSGLHRQVAKVEVAVAPLDQMNLALLSCLEDGVGDLCQRAPVGLRELGCR
jgi:hypothetical protein